MSIRHLLAVIAVSDLDVSVEWYTRLFGAPPTNVPMPGLLAEYRVTGHGWVQLTTQVGPAGSGFLNLAVDGEDDLREVRRRGIDVGPPVGVNKGVSLVETHDPDGTTVTFILDFRDEY
jgi:glyoxylase I family protein